MDSGRTAFAVRLFRFAAVWVASVHKSFKELWYSGIGFEIHEKGEETEYNHRIRENSLAITGGVKYTNGRWVRRFGVPLRGNLCTLAGFGGCRYGICT